MEHHRLPQVELHERSRKGPCFKCGDKWNTQHRCKGPQLQLLLIDDDDEEDGDTKAAPVRDVPVGIPSEEEALFQMSMFSLLGLSSNQSMKLWGSIRRERLVMMVDSGASRNFVERSVAERLKLTVEATPTYNVVVGDGYKVQCQGVCRNFTIDVQGAHSCQDLFLFELGGAEVILGLDWLKGWGEMKADFGNLTLKVCVEGREVTLKGDPVLSNTTTVTMLRSMVKALSTAQQGFVVDQHWQQEGTKAVESLWPELEALLSDYAAVFQEPQGLRPKRRQDHSICLKAGSTIPNVRPYRYPYYQKAIIENLVSELLVSMIEELLDELGGAKVFSKLDLKSGKGRTEHVQHLQRVFEALSDNGLVANRKKCSFLISQHGVCADPKKVEAILQWPIPKSLKSLRGFLGLTGYYQKFVQDYGKIAKPLTDLLKKDGFIWHDQTQFTFDTLKTTMTTLPVLAFPDFTKPFMVVTNASGRGVGAVLM
ncbi:uncharacterized protein LOC133308882 [Gastrolobium bilobum]|uniref:uncharacterized protein LOC133308882 n=1 Tax=Gastrolobium bilobum TaxID=150636 RepID=UPI002AAF27DD|nr:uncharacterized protein LOC133308882 [Gastrolobium bilobum]